jgi:hypothetical protein
VSAPPKAPPVALAAAISEDRQRSSIVSAGREIGGTRLLVDLVWYDHPRGVVDRLVALDAGHDPVALVLDPMSQAGTLLRPLADAGLMVVRAKAQDVAVAHGDFLDLVNDGGLAHLNQPPLTAAVRAAQQRRLSGAQAWERKLAVDQSPLEAATLAAWAFLGWEVQSEPGAWDT